MKIVYFTDFDLAGSGYLNLSIPICTELVNRGHELKAVGLGYKGEEHYHPFSIIPVPTIQCPQVFPRFLDWHGDH